MNFNWLFRPWYVWKLRQQLNSPFKMKNEADAIKSGCLAEIQHSIEPLWLSVKKILFHLGIKTIQNNRARLHRDEFGLHTISPNPLFPQSLITRVFRKYWINVMAIVLFVSSEGYLYLITASLFVPGGNELTKVSVAIFLALLTMFALDYGFTQHFKYRHIKSLVKGEGISKEELKTQSDLRILGYILIGISLLAVIFSGFARIYFLEFVPTNGLSSEKLKAVQHASKWASLLTMAVTLITAILLALIKREQTSIADQYHVCRYWKKALKGRNKYTQSLIHDTNKLILTVEQAIEKHWQLVIDVKRIYKMPQEYDEKYEAMDSEYLEIKSKPGFTLNDHLYRKFAPLQGAHEELFRYGIYSATEVREKIAFVNSLQKIPEEYLMEHINAIYHQGQKQNDASPTPTNGTLKDNSTLNQTKHQKV
ncbi:MAG: cytochrome b/b6 domain-containing protein [Chitinophagaceae bacterium]|nr:cytochrome b/b6 domain-containing protein [Chitinophagaceae bacterium]